MFIEQLDHNLESLDEIIGKIKDEELQKRVMILKFVFDTMGTETAPGFVGLMFSKLTKEKLDSYSKVLEYFVNVLSEEQIKSLETVAVKKVVRQQIMEKVAAGEIDPSQMPDLTQINVIEITPKIMEDFEKGVPMDPALEQAILQIKLKQQNDKKKED